MIEISGRIGAPGRIAYGGDVVNVAVGLARLGQRPALLTALGTDPWSEQLVAAWLDERIDLDLVARHPEKLPGLYGIQTDELGERTFTYWRENSAVRDLFALPEAERLMAAAARADLLFLSGITLALYDDEQRARIAQAAKAVRARGGIVAFDGNYRPRLWPDASAARTAYETFAPYVTLALPTASDEKMLRGYEETPEAIARRWHDLGANEVVVKLGAAGAYTSERHGDAHFVPAEKITPVDTSGAGDAFDAAYLTARLAGAPSHVAAAIGHGLAKTTIMHVGAIPPREQ